MDFDNESLLRCFCSEEEEATIIAWNKENEHSRSDIFEYRLEEADKLKEEGNEFFKSGDFETARQRYYGAIWHLDFDIGQQWNLMDHHQLDLNTRKLKVISNICGAYLKSKDRTKTKKTWSRCKGESSCGSPRSCRRSVLSATFPGALRAPFTVVALRSPSCSWVLVLASSVDFCWSSVPSVPLDFALSLIRASNSLWTCRLAHFDGLIDFQVTCMSDRVSSQDISDLTSAIRDLTIAINPPEPDPETSSLGDWELLGEESEDIAVSRDAGCLEVRFRTLEEGPGPTPLYCVDLANRKLSGKPPGPSARCRRAFVAGFFAKKAVQCQTLYFIENPLPGFKIVHWVVLRCPPVFSEPVRFTNRVDFGRAIEACSGDLVVEPFASFTEVEIFCIGAGIRIPRSKPATMAIPLVARSGGLLIAVPEPYLDNDALLDAALDSHDGVLGPSQEFMSELCEEDDETNLVPLGRTCSVMVLDVSDAALAHFAEYDPVTHDFDSCLSFDNDRPAALPAMTDILEDIKAWIQATAEGSRVHFYSAREEIEEPAPPKAAASRRVPPKKITNQAIMDQLSSLSMQMQALASQQEELRQGATQASVTPVPVASGLLPISSKMPNLSGGLRPPGSSLASVAKLVGPPPKTKPPDVSNVAKDPVVAPSPIQNIETTDHSSIVHAISQQSMALTALVSHLAGGDPMSELQMGGAGSSGLSLSTRGAARRERMQQDLAARRSNYFLQVQQQLFRTMFPSQQVPQSEAELVGAGATMTAYLEKHGGYKNQKDQAMALWIAAHAMDCAMMDDMHGCKEFLAILVTCLEQAAHDGGWGVAYLLSLLEAPPSNVFSGITRPFSPLVPQPWAACALAYIKEMDVLTNKKVELRGGGGGKPKHPPAAPAATAEDTEKTPSPRYCHVMPANPSASRRRQCHLSRVLHTTIMALNFWYSGGKFIDSSALQRAPNRLHRVLFRRIRSLLKSDGPALAFETTKAGRRFPELVARLSELSEVMTYNGVSGDPYCKTFGGVDVVKDDSVMPELQPYRDLDPSRLLLYGSGHFDATDFLDDPLVLPYRDPSILSVNVLPGPRPSMRESPKTLGQLASVWDKQGLLMIHKEAIDPNKYVRIFNAYKSECQDRQIGDRRGANSLESRISSFGPSSQLPAGCDLGELCIDPKKQSLAISITDRKDFYHQFWCSRQKTLGNSLGPPIHEDFVKTCGAYGDYLQRYAKKRYDRSREGDRLDCRHPALLSNQLCHIAFRSVLQGDHCGVDIATCAHTSVLRAAGLLRPGSQLVANQPLRSVSSCQGLVIDDFFSVTVERDGTLPEESQAYQDYQVSQSVYSKYQLLGSPQKDILGLSCGKIIGAWVDSREETRRRGLTTVSAPPQKRLGLSHVSLSVAALSHTTDSLHLCLIGGWVSAMGFRRPMYSLFQKAYGLVDTLAFDPNHPKLVPLPRNVARELVLAAILHPLMVTDIGALYHDRIYATDASQHKGAICSMPVSREYAEIIWKTSRSKGSYTRLQTPAEALLKRLGIDDECDLPDGFRDEPSPNRPLAYRFDFVEVYAGAAKVTKHMVGLGFSACPPLDLSYSEEYDLRYNHVLAWLTYLVSERLVLAIMLEPPCTTYSIIRRPALRSKDVPFGFRPDEEKTKVGNQLAARACQVFYIAAINFVAAMLETTFSSLLKHLPFYKAAASVEGAKQVRVDSCRFGSPHLKSFRMLCAHIKTEAINLRCRCCKPHLQVQGKYTKASATYTDELSLAIAKTFGEWIVAEKSRLSEDASPSAKGLESCAINNLAISGEWSVDSAWSFRKESHINILEESALLRLAQRCTKLAYPTRLTVLVDSNVVRGATAKGRSSSLGLSTVLRRLNAICVAAAIYMHIAFVPTRLNISDDPTRDRPLRAASSGIDVSGLSRDELFDFFLMHKLRRPGVLDMSQDWLNTKKAADIGLRHMEKAELKDDDAKGKFHYRKGFANLQRGFAEDAYASLKQADSLIAGDKQVRQALKEAAEHQKVDREKAKEVWKSKLLTEEEKSCQGSWTQPSVVFATSKTLSMRQAAELDPWMLFSEGSEGVTLIMAKEAAEKHDLEHEGPFCRITLMVHSSLEAVGLTAAVARALSDAGISANVVAAFHHDHVYVPAQEAERAVSILKGLGEKCC
eukprot:symbB.v1.2.034454.t5/scaffold4448.1/size41344/4